VRSFFAKLGLGILTIVGLVASDVVDGATLRFRVELYGLTDAEHTLSSGWSYSFPWYLGEKPSGLLSTGQLVGYSIQTLSDDTYGGQSAWISNRGDTTRIGLINELHTRDDGYRVSTALLQTSSGVLGGYSTRFAGADAVGASAWLITDNQIQQVGLSATLPPNSIPAISDTIEMINDSGQAAGISYTSRFQHTSQSSRAWIYTPDQGTLQIGLADEEHSDSVGNSYNLIHGLNNRGQVIGTARRKQIDGTLRPGYADGNQTAWLFDGRQTIQIGLTDERHTGSLGSRSSTPVAVTGAGLVAGHSAQFAGGFCIHGSDGNCVFDYANGKTAWTFHNGVLRTVGLVDDPFVDDEGATTSLISAVEESGFVAGISLNNQNDGTRLDTPWLDNGVDTVAIDVPRPGWSDLVRSESKVHSLSNSGRVVGDTIFQNSEDTIDYRAWEYADGRLRLLGLFGESYQNADGTSINWVFETIEDKYVLGLTQYAVNGVDRTALWIDDGEKTMSLEPTLEDTPPDQQRYSQVRAFNSSGQLVGRTVQFLPDDFYRITDWFYDPATGMEIVEIPDGKLLIANGISDTGWVFGGMGDGWSGSGGFIAEEAFLWHSSTGLLRISDLVANSHLPADLRLTQLVDGLGNRRFAGIAYTETGAYAFLALAVPEPGFNAMVTFGIVGVVLLRLRIRRFGRN
jgi:hypothetical protein